MARDRGGVEVEAKRERMDVLGRRKGSEPKEEEAEAEVGMGELGWSGSMDLDMSKVDTCALAGGARSGSAGTSSEVMGVTEGLYECRN